MSKTENNKHYKTLDEDPTKQYNEEINQILEQVSNINFIDRKTLENLKTKFLTTANFYTLP